MYRLRIEPAGYELPAPHNATVLEAANAAGYFWPVGCNRNGECTNCAMHIISGLGRVSPIGRYERQTLIRQRGPRSI
ncbi:2Fe-2S iron-sulfur cluster-binding protein, partial [Tepidiforma sp.]|uniref:2Fe-2S iron-sulfur cluster-binding protein n=1 Tax=Tepidiforma sp. TaxID=2682230 RepID=UPI002ADDEF17